MSSIDKQWRRITRIFAAVDKNMQPATPALHYHLYPYMAPTQTENGISGSGGSEG